MTAPDIVVLTGAGISQESGLAPFRDPGGLWQRVRIEDVATPEAFARDPARVQAFYNARRAQLLDPAVQPNAAHAALAQLEWRYPGKLTLVTQNVDDLHERAGSGNVIHMHGALRRARCLVCGASSPWDAAMEPASACPACEARGRLRPDVVWFGEMPLRMDEIEAALDACGLFVSIGTSGAVYPAAGFAAQVAGRAETVELNLEPSGGLFDRSVHGRATEIVPAFVRETIARWT
jgi:NAD-dependent deacetylase